MMNIKQGKTWRLIVLTLFIYNVVYAQDLPADTAIVAFVDGEPVIMREFMQQAQKKRSQVIRFFRINYESEYDDGFWIKTFDGKTPSDVLKEETMDTLVEIKIQQIMAKKNAIVSDISYSGFLKALEEENLRRLEEKQAGKVIYGPVQYSEVVYFNYLFSNMVIRLKSALSEKVFHITAEKLKEAYEKDKDSLYRKGYYTEIRLIEMKFSPGVNDTETGRLREKAFEAIISVSDRVKHDDSCTGTLKEIYNDDPDLSLEISDLVFNDSISSPEEENPVRTMVKTKAENLEPAQCSPVVEFQDILYIIQVKNRISLGYRDFDNCKSTIRESLTDQMYEQYVNGLKANANVELNKDIYQRIHF